MFSLKQFSFDAIDDEPALVDYIVSRLSMGFRRHREWSASFANERQRKLARNSCGLPDVQGLCVDFSATSGQKFQRPGFEYISVSML
jgi:hypothetical protein